MNLSLNNWVEFWILCDSDDINVKAAKYLIDFIRELKRRKISPEIYHRFKLLNRTNRNYTVYLKFTDWTSFSPCFRHIKCSISQNCIAYSSNLRVFAQINQKQRFQGMLEQSMISPGVMSLFINVLLIETIKFIQIQVF